MKKNILTIVIIAAILADIVISAITLFAVVPTLKRSDEFIMKICSILDIELESPNADAYADVPIDKRVNHTLSGTVTINLQKATPDEKVRYAIVASTLTFNSESKSYELVYGMMPTSEEIIKGFIIDEISQYTADEISLIDTKTQIKEVVLKKIQNYFQTDCIIDITINIFLQ